LDPAQPSRMGQNRVCPEQAKSGRGKNKRRRWRNLAWSKVKVVGVIPGVVGKT